MDSRTEKILLEKIEQLEKELERTKESSGKIVAGNSGFSINADVGIIGGWTIPKPLPPEIPAVKMPEYRDERQLPFPRIELRFVMPSKDTYQWVLCLLYADNKKNLCKLEVDSSPESSPVPPFPPSAEHFNLPYEEGKDAAHLAKELNLPGYVTWRGYAFLLWLDEIGQPKTKLYDVRPTITGCCMPFCC